MTAGQVPAPRVVVAGGHSAGHIEPMLNFADALRRLEPTAVITSLGTTRGLDTTLIPSRGYPLELIPPVPLPRRMNRALLNLPTRLCVSVRSAGAVLDKVHAEVLVGFGGYVSAPAYLAARMRGLAIVVHEANAQPGMANRLGAHLTTHVFTAAPGVRLPQAKVIGIPLRPAISQLDRLNLRDTARRRFGLRTDLPVLMVTGGSQGAGTINAAVSRAAPSLRAHGVQVLHITGPQRRVDVPGGDFEGAPYVVVPYVDDMQYVYAAADFAICRSGAMTCAELGAVGLPAAYVPLPLRGGEHAVERRAGCGGRRRDRGRRRGPRRGLDRDHADPAAHGFEAAQGDVGTGVGIRRTGCRRGARPSCTECCRRPTHIDGVRADFT